MSVSFKEGVVVKFNKYTAAMIDAAEMVWALKVFSKNHGPVVTSGREGRHGAQSLHYVDRALDFRTRNLKNSTKRKVSMGMQIALGEDYDVVLESDHLHVEYDPE